MNERDFHVLSLNLINKNERIKQSQETPIFEIKRIEPRKLYQIWLWKVRRVLCARSLGWRSRWFPFHRDGRPFCEWTFLRSWWCGLGFGLSSFEIFFYFRHPCIFFVHALEVPDEVEQKTWTIIETWRVAGDFDGNSIGECVLVETIWDSFIRSCRCFFQRDLRVSQFSIMFCGGSCQKRIIEEVMRRLTSHALRVRYLPSHAPLSRWYPSTQRLCFVGGVAHSVEFMIVRTLRKLKLIA